MYIYFIFMAIVGLIAGIVIAVRSKKAEGVVYGKLDRVGMITNILLVPVYFIASIFCMFVVMLGCSPAGEGLWGLVSLIVSMIGSTGSVLCGLGLGASVAWRRAGKSKLSFLVQFVGVAGLGLVLLFFALFHETLFASLN